jgi:hypothetical protein
MWRDRRRWRRLVSEAAALNEERAGLNSLMAHIEREIADIDRRADVLKAKAVALEPSVFED